MAEEWVLHSVMQWARLVTPIHAGDGNLEDAATAAPKMVSDGEEWARLLLLSRPRSQNAARLRRLSLATKGVARTRLGYRTPTSSRAASGYDTVASSMAAISPLFRRKGM